MHAELLKFRQINGFDGFEAICFYNDIVYVNIEAEYEGLMYGYLIWGRISSDNYDINFPAIVRNKNIWGIQYHPEKRHLNGMDLLKNI